MKKLGRLLALRVALLYLAGAGLWILLSDRLLALLVADVALLAALQTWKGWGFVLVTAGLLYLILATVFAEREAFSQQLEAHARRQEAVATLRQYALSHAALATVLNEAVVLVAITLEVEYSAVFEQSADGTGLVLCSGVGWRNGLVGTARVPAQADTLIGAVLHQPEPVVLADLPTHAPDPLLVEQGIASSLAIVIVGREQPFGVLTAHTQQPRRFTSDERRFLQAVASVLASAISRENAEAELRQQKTLLECQSEASLDGILAVSPERRILACNQRFVTMWGLPPTVLATHSAERLLQRAVEQVAAPQQFVAEIEALYASPNRTSNEEILLKDGRIFDRYSAPITSAHQDYYGRVWYYRDVTEMRQTQDAYRNLVEHSLQGFAIYQDSRIVFANPAMASITGYRIDEMLALTPDELDALIYPADWEQAQVCLQGRCHRNGTPSSCDYRILRKDGAIRWLAVASIGVAYRGRPAIQVAYVDMTERKHAEASLKRRNQELAALNMVTEAVSLFLNLPDVLATLRVLLADHFQVAAGSIFIYHEAEDQLSLELAWGLPDDLVEQMRWLPVAHAHNAQVVREQTPLSTFDIAADVPGLARLLAADAARPHADWCCYLGVPLLAQGETQGVVDMLWQRTTPLSAEQISLFATLGQQVGTAIQHARLYEEVRAGRRQLRALSHRLVEVQEVERQTLAHELHEEIGQVLSGLSLSLELVGRLPADQVAGRLEHAQGLVNELMLRVRALSLDLRPPMLDDLGLLATLLWYFEHYTARSGIQVQFWHTGIEGRFAPEIETALYRMVQEALANVTRYAGVATVAVRLWASDERISVHVEDAGCGFDPAAALQSNSASGLAAMRERTLLLGGTLEVEAAPGQGCCLMVELPLK